MIRVVVVDDEALVRSGFQLILAGVPDIEVVAAIDALEAVETIRELTPEVVLLDVRMPGRDGLDILEELRTWSSPPVVAILTTFDTDDHIARALGLGAAGFLVKDTDPQLLPAHIRSLAAGGIVLSPQVSRTVIDGYLSGGDRQAALLLASLTPRELDVLRQLKAGRSNTEIGAELYLSVGTVKDHVSSLLSKLGVSTRLQAALVAERGGLDEGTRR